MTWLLLLLPLALFILGVPIFAVLLTTAAVALVTTLPMPPIALHQLLFGGIDKYALLAVPFFVFAGELMSRGGIAERLVAWVLALTGRLPGSLGVATVGTATLMGAVSGSSPATVAAVGRSLYPSLLQQGYGQRFSLGLIASSGSIAVVVPPSIAMILYGASAEQSIPKLFQAGLLPGLLIALAMALTIMVWAKGRDLGPRQAVSLDVILAATRHAWAALLMPVVILAGIYLGWFSPTEAGGVACLYALLIACLLYRSLSWRDVLDAAGEAALLTAQILIIVAAAGVFSWLLTVKGVPQSLVQALIALELSPPLFLLLVNLLLLGIGCLLDPTSAILVLTPLLLPLVLHLGIDPIHFGIVMTVNLSIGMFTPPFGLNLFVAQSVLSPDLAAIYRGILPFLAVQLLCLAAITYLPPLSLILLPSP
ncbi:MAG: TRAP transporter large permease [Rhodospirillales bacterium]